MVVVVVRRVLLSICRFALLVVSQVLPQGVILTISLELTCAVPKDNST